MKLYTVKKAAALIGCSTNTLYKYLNEGRLKASRGTLQQGRFRIPQSSIEQFLGTAIDESTAAKAQYAAPRPQTNTPTKFPLRLTRALIVVGLLFLLVDIVISPAASMVTQISRSVFAAVMILLAYQEGGYV